MKRKDNIPSELLDKLFGIEPDPKQEPMSNDWFEKHEQQTRDEEAKRYWSTEKAYLAQQEFLLRRDVTKRRSKQKTIKWRGSTE
jgi:hypothetical protein